MKLNLCETSNSDFELKTLVPLLVLWPPLIDGYDARENQGWLDAYNENRGGDQSMLIRYENSGVEWHRSLREICLQRCVCLFDWSRPVHGIKEDDPGEMNWNRTDPNPSGSRKYVRAMQRHLRSYSSFIASFLFISSTVMSVTRRLQKTSYRMYSWRSGWTVPI